MSLVSAAPKIRTATADFPTKDPVSPQASPRRSDATSRPRRPLRADLHSSCSDATAYGGMVGLGETYLPAFVLAIGLGELTAGLIGSLPLVAGGLMQTVSPYAVRFLGSHKRWVVTCAAVQACAYVPLALAAVWGTISIPAIFAIATLYWAAGLATGPAWNTWIGTIVPKSVRARYFAVRTRWSQAAIFLGFVVSGLTLQYAGSAGRLLTAYAVLFTAAAACRAISVLHLCRQSEPTPIPSNMRHVPICSLLHHLKNRQGGRLLVYLIAVQASVQMSGPYFTPFMFEKLRLSYAQFVALISVAFLAKVVALPLWGHVAHRIGARRLLWIGGVGITPLSGCWLISQDVSWLLFIQAAGGILWAAYELAFFLLFFESIPEEERTSLLTLYNVINTLAWVGGALLGGAILYSGGASTASYLWVFAASSVGRSLSLFLLARVPAMDVAANQIGVRSVAVRPNTASLDQPVLPSLPDQTQPAEEGLATTEAAH